MFAKMYPKMAASGDSIGFAEVREWAMSRVVGTGVEIGCGDGRNFEHLPVGSRLVAIEPEPALAAAATRRAAGRDIDVIEGVGEYIGATPQSMDFVVTTLTLCSVGDLDATLAQAHRLLKPNGLLIVVEHILSSSPAFAAWQRIADLLWPHLSGGCRPTRDIIRAINRAGFTKSELIKFDFPSSKSLSPARPMFKGAFEKTDPGAV